MKTQRWMTRVGVVLGLAVFGLAVSVRGQECPELVGEQDVGFSFHPARIKVSGSLVFLGGPHRGPTGGCKGGGPSPLPVEIIDVSDPEDPRVLGVVGGPITDISASEDRLYILSSYCRETSHWETVTVYEVANGEQPHRLDYFSDGGQPSWSYIEAVDDTVFLATSDGLSALDATDPSNPNELGTLEIPWEPSGLFAEGELLYVAEPNSGLRIIDVADPTNPVEIGLWATTWEARNFEVLDGFAYVADGAGGLKVIDVTNPSMPTELSTLHTAAEASQVSVAGSYAIIVLSDGDVLLVDVSDPGNPEKVGVFAGEGPAMAAALSGATAYISEGDSDSFPDGRFQVVNLEHPDAPVESAFFGYQRAVMDIEVKKDVQYVAGGFGGLIAVDLTVDHLKYAIHSFLDTPGFALGVALHGDLAIVADGSKGLRIIDVSDPANMVEVGFVDTPGQARRVAMADDYAYVADGEGGLRIIDISIPEAPIEVGAVATPDPVVDVAVEGDFAYVADGHLRMIDMSDRANPVWVGLNLQIPAYALAIRDEVLFLAGANLSVFSLPYPATPKLLASGQAFPWSTEPTGVFLSGNHAYVTTEGKPRGSSATGRAWGPESGTVEIFEIQNTYFPSRVGGWKRGTNCWAVAVEDGQIFLADGQDEVVILDNRCLTTYWVELVAHQSGLGGSQWRSDVIIGGWSDLCIPRWAAGFGLEFILHTTDGVITGDAAIRCGGSGVFEDIVGILGYEGKGALEIRSERPLSVSSRVYNLTESGTSGGYYPGYRSLDCLDDQHVARLYGLRQVEGEYRTNISVTNITDEVRWVYVFLQDAAGNQRGDFSFKIDPGMTVQALQPFVRHANTPNLGWGNATVMSDKGGILTSATVIDSRTNDAVVVPMTPEIPF